MPTLHGDARMLYGCTIAAGSSLLQTRSAVSTQDLGRYVSLEGAGTLRQAPNTTDAANQFRQPLFAKIVAVWESERWVELDKPAVADSSGQRCVCGHDDTEALQELIDELAVLDPGRKHPAAHPLTDAAEPDCCNVGGTVDIPDGWFLVRGGVALPTCYIGDHDGYTLRLPNSGERVTITKAYEGIVIRGAGRGRTIIEQIDPDFVPQPNGKGKGVIAVAHNCGNYAYRQRAWAPARPMGSFAIEGVTLRQCLNSTRVLHALDLGTVNAVLIKRCGFERGSYEGVYGGVAAPLRARDGECLTGVIMLDDVEVEDFGWGGPARSITGCTAGVNVFGWKAVARNVRVRRCAQTFESGGFEVDIADCDLDGRHRPEWAHPACGPRDVGGVSNSFGQYRLRYRNCTIRTVGRFRLGNLNGVFRDAVVEDCYIEGKVELQSGLAANTNHGIYAPDCVVAVDPVNGKPAADARAETYGADGGMPWLFSRNTVRLAGVQTLLMGGNAPAEGDGLRWHVTNNVLLGDGVGKVAVQIVTKNPASVRFAGNKFRGLPQAGNVPFARFYLGDAATLPNVVVADNEWPAGTGAEIRHSNMLHVPPKANSVNGYWWPLTMNTAWPGVQ